LQSIGINIKTEYGNIVAAIYDNDGNLLAQSSNATAVNGWNDLPISGVPIAAGETPKIAFEFNDSLLVVYRLVNTLGRYNSTLTYGTFPSTLPIGNTYGVLNSRIIYSSSLAGISNHIFGITDTPICTNDTESASLYLNDSSTSYNNTNILLGAGSYKWTCNTTAFSISSTQLITESSSSASLSIIPSSPIISGTYSTASCSATNPETSPILYRNSSDVTATENGIATVLLLGEYNYTCNVTSTQNYTSASTSQIYSVYNANITDCSIAGSVVSKMFYFYNELSPFPKLNGSMNAHLYFSLNNFISNYNFTATNETWQICIFPNYANFTVYGQIQYNSNTSGVYTTRDYYLDAANFDNSTDELNLYLLPISNSSLVKLTAKDQYSNPYSNVVIYIQRYYPELNAYKTVAGPLSDSTGVTNTYLQMYDTYYRFIMQKDGIVLQTIPASKITITDLTLMVQPLSLVNILKYWNAITGSVNYTESTGYLKATYSDTSGYMNETEFNVWQIGALSKSQICSITNSSNPGTMYCYIGISSNTYEYKLTAKLNTGGIYDHYEISSGLINAIEGVSQLFGSCKNPANIIALFRLNSLSLERREHL
jgi:hypothetical protein